MPFLSRGDMVAGEPLPGWRGRFFHAEHMTVAHYDVSAGAPDLHEHHHVQEEVWSVVAGSITLVIAGDEQELGPGDAAVVPPGIPHAARVTGACSVVVVDHPRRDELPGGLGRTQDSRSRGR